MVVKFIIALSILMVGCSEADQDHVWPRETFQLQSGSVVDCRWVEQTSCGMKLYDCVDGQTYNCQTNVRKQ